MRSPVVHDQTTEDSSDTHSLEWELRKWENEGGSCLVKDDVVGERLEAVDTGAIEADVDRLGKTFRP